MSEKVLTSNEHILYKKRANGRLINVFNTVYYYTVRCKWRKLWFFLGFSPPPRYQILWYPVAIYQGEISNYKCVYTVYTSILCETIQNIIHISWNQYIFFFFSLTSLLFFSNDNKSVLQGKTFLIQTVGLPELWDRGTRR